MAGRGTVSKMRLHRAVNLHDMAALQAALEAGDDVNEVEGVRCARPEAACVRALWQGSLSRPQAEGRARSAREPHARAAARAQPARAPARREVAVTEVTVR